MLESFRTLVFPAYELPATAFLAALAYFALRGRFSLPDSRAGVVRWCAAWAAGATALSWILGPASAGAPQYELHLSIAMHQHAASLPVGVKFAHAVGGGMDIHTLPQSPGYYVSFERFLAAVLPEWLAAGIHRALVVVIALAGAYRLCRALGCARPGALGAALLSSAAIEIYQDGFWLATGMAALPLAAYLLICRQGRRYYWTGVFVFGAWTAVSSVIPVTVLNLMFAVPFAALFINWRSIPRAAAALAAAAGFILLNAHEQIYGMAAAAPHAARSENEGYIFSDFSVYVIETVLTHSVVLTVMALAGAAAAVFVWACGRADAAVRRAALCVALYPPACFAAAVFPYGALGAEFLQTAGWSYLGHGWAVPVIVLAAQTLRIFPALGRASAAAAAGRIAVVNAVAAAISLSEGGFASARLESPANAPWKQEDMVRAVSVPWRLSPNQLPGAGFEAADAYVHLQTKRSARYWAAVVSGDADVSFVNMAGRGPIGPGLYRLGLNSIIKCCPEYDIADYGVDVDLLRLINVGRIISRVPLTGPYVTQIAGVPHEDFSLPRSDTPYAERVIPYIKWILAPPPPFVYALHSPFPRVYAPEGRVTAPDRADYKTFINMIRRHALKGGLVLRESDAETLGPAPAAARVTSAEQVLNGYDVTLDPSESPGGAVVLLNVVYTPPWRAYADGVPVPLAPANLIHMAAAVPPGARRLTFRYERPFLREKLFGGGG